MKVYITVIAVCLNKFHIWGNSHSRYIAQNALGQSGLQDFSINCRTLKLVVFHKEVNEINGVLVCPCNNILRNGSLGFSDLGTMVDNSNIEKLSPSFQENSFLAQSWAESAQNGSKISFF